MIKKTAQNFRELLNANEQAIFVRTKTKRGQAVDLPLSMIQDPVEKERHIMEIIDRQLKRQEEA